MTQAHIAVLLYAIGGALEFGGVFTIGLDLAATRRRARTYKARGRNVTVLGVGALGFTSALGAKKVTGGHEPTQAERITALEELAEGEAERIREVVLPIRTELNARTDQAMKIADDSAREREQDIVHLIGPEGPARRAWVGFIALLLGVVVGTAGNIISATS